MNVVRLSNTNKPPPGRACLTCRYRQGSGGSIFWTCGFFGGYSTETARSYDHLCGENGRAWESRPPKPPIGGIIGWLIKLFVGEGK